MKNFKLFINNEWVESSNKKTFNSCNPATGASLAQLSFADKNDVDKAVNAAKAAFDSGVWSELSGDERADYMLKAADLMKSRFDELAIWEAKDTGKPISETGPIDITYSIRAMEYFANAARSIKGEVIPIPGDYAFDYVTYEPYGVIGTISPWNFPLHLFTRAICPALATGNTVVAKASSSTPITTQIMGEIFKEAGFPAGVINIISGSGSIAGEAILNHPDISMISFTGSEEIGREILKKSSEAPIIKKVILELGGKGAFIAEPDCDINSAVNSAITGFCLNQGEVCCASTRLYLHEDIYDSFIGLLLERINKIKIGDTLDPSTQMGALINKNQYEIVDSYVKEAISQGATLLAGGERYINATCDKGYFYTPTVLSTNDNNMKCVKEEIFGPVLVVLKYKDIEEAISLANDNSYSLGATIWSENPRKLYWAAKKLDAGTVWMNTNVMSKIEAPYGGNKNSGLGREDGTQGLMEYLKVKNNILFVGREYDNFYNF